MAEDRTQVNLVVSEQQKSRWENHVEESNGEFQSVSQLIRRGVEKEISDDETAGESGISENVTEQLSEIVEGMNRIESRIHDLDNRVATVESEVSEDPEVKQIASEVFEVLPTRDELVEYEKKVRKSGAVPDPKLPISYTGRVEDISSQLDEPEHRIEKAVEKLQEDTHQVHTIVLNEEISGWAQEYDEGDQTRYYKHD